MWVNRREKGGVAWPSSETIRQDDGWRRLTTALLVICSCCHEALDAAPQVSVAGRVSCRHTETPTHLARAGPSLAAKEQHPMVVLLRVALICLALAILISAGFRGNQSEWLWR